MKLKMPWLLSYLLIAIKDIFTLNVFTVPTQALLIKYSSFMSTNAYFNRCNLCNYLRFE